VDEGLEADVSARSELPALAPEAAADDRVGTRNKVARLILAHGPCTAADLAARLKLTPAGVRRHVDALLAEGLVEAREQRVYGHRGRGRPAKVFALTGSGRAVFHHAYDELAVDALRYLAETAGGAAVHDFARRRLGGLVERYGSALAGSEPAERAALLAQALTADGYAAAVREAGVPSKDPRRAAPGEQLCQHHCPVQHVAEEFPQLCEAETQVFAELLGTHVQRLATIAHGDGVCTTFIPTPPFTPAPPGAAKAEAAASAAPAAETFTTPETPHCEGDPV
jgi:predicted ArsR family transcriptional regulator